VEKNINKLFKDITSRTKIHFSPIMLEASASAGENTILPKDKKV
jgi:hypothetical protein